MTVKKRWTALFPLLTIAGNALADGLPLKAGRYPGDVVILELTQDQKRVIDHFRTCHMERFKTMNPYTPYVFKLTRSQQVVLSRKVGYAPKLFQVYETYRGFNDAGPHWNLVLRFSEDQVEVPLDLLQTDDEADKEHAMQGWARPNPCFPKQ